MKGRFRAGGGRGAPQLLPRGGERQRDIEAEHHVSARQAMQQSIPGHDEIEGREIPSFKA